LPPPHLQSPPRCASAPPRCASPLSWAAWRRALPRPPQALSPLPPPQLLAREGQAPTSRGEPAPHHSPPPPPHPTTSTPKSPEKRVSTARATGTPHSSVPGAPIAGSSSPSCAPPAPVPAAAPRARALGLGAWTGRTAWRSRSPAAGNERKVTPRRHAVSKWRERRQRFHSPAGHGGA
jgi:hypothetical protein